VSSVPKTRYAKSGELNIAYQVLGEGPRDLVYAPGWLSNVEMAWENPELARFLRRLASFNRLIVFHKRGTGLSDRVADVPTLEQRMDDVRAVMDAVDSPRAALFGHSEGASMCLLFATTYPGDKPARQGARRRQDPPPGQPSKHSIPPRSPIVTARDQTGGGRGPFTQPDGFRASPLHPTGPARRYRLGARVAGRAR
jgi:pimeloyl-ACP methyl ester carboxylesterase